MKKVLLAGLSGAILLAGASSTYAATREGAVAFTPFGEYYSFSGKRHLKNGGGFGANIGYFVTKNIDVEFGVGRMTARQDRSPKKTSTIMQYGLNAYYYFGPFWQRLQPYAGGGVNIWHFSRVISSSVTNTQTNLDVAAGLAFFVTDAIALRAGGVYNYTVTVGGRSDVGVNGGVMFMFGGHSDNAAPTKNNVNSKVKAK